MVTGRRSPSFSGEFVQWEQKEWLPAGAQCQGGSTFPFRELMKVSSSCVKTGMWNGRRKGSST